MLIILFPSQPVSAESNQFARISSEISYLYRTASDSETVENKWCLLPQTFFVKILTNYNQTHYKVQFADLVGYVKKADMQLVVEVPKNPYPTATTFTIKNSTSCYLRSTPVVKGAISNIVSIIPASSEVKFLGKTIGEEAIDLQGTVWYFAQFNNQIGYVYHAYSTTFLPVQTNTEVVTLKLSATSTTLNPLCNASSVLLIVIISIPVVIMLTMLYTPKKLKQRKVKVNHSPNNVMDKTDIFRDEQL